MKFQKLKDTVQLTSLIFTGIAVLGAATGQTFHSGMLWGFLVSSVLSAVIKIRFFSESLFAASIPRQIAYLLSVWLIFISCSLLSGWGVTPKAAVSILGEVLIIYFVIRLVNYQLVKMEVKQMNQRLESPEEKERKTSD